MPKMTNPNNPLHFARLRRAMEYNRGRLKTFRENRIAAWRQYVGKHYSDQGSGQPVPVNFIELAIDVYLRFLVGGDPLITSMHSHLRSQATDFTLALKQKLDEINYPDTDEMWTKEALFSVGILKAGITSGVRAEVAGFLHDAGQPFADTVLLDNFVFDTSAHVWEQVQMAGDRFQLPTDLARDLYKSADIHPTGLRNLNIDGDERSEAISNAEHSSGADDARYIPVTEFWDMWLPADNLIVTIPDEGSQDKPLAVVEADYPEEGPYHLLHFSRVAGSILPLPPVALWMDIHELANILFNKLGRQATRQKKVNTFRGGDEDPERLNRTADGEWARIDDPQGINEIVTGGITQDNLAFFLTCRGLANYVAGNVDALAGLSAQAGTLGQEEILTRGAAQRLVRMRERKYRSQKRVMRHLAWMEWTDPLRKRVLQRTIPGGQTIEQIWSEATREGDFLQHDFDVLMSSIGAQSPEERMARLRGVFNDFVAPYAEMMVQQGVVPDFQELFKMIGEYQNLPELERAIKVMPTQRRMQSETSPRIKQSPNTQRQYVRKNVPGASMQGQEQVMTNMLMGGKPQKAERASLDRIAG